MKVSFFLSWWMATVLSSTQLLFVKPLKQTNDDSVRTFKIDMEIRENFKHNSLHAWIFVEQIWHLEICYPCINASLLTKGCDNLWWSSGPMCKFEIFYLNNRKCGECHFREQDAGAFQGNALDLLLPLKLCPCLKAKFTSLNIARVFVPLINLKILTSTQGYFTVHTLKLRCILVFVH